MKTTSIVLSKIGFPTKRTSMKNEFLFFLMALLPMKINASGPGTPKSAIDLQAYRESNTITIDRGPFAEKTATLTNLDPAVNAWHLLSIQPVGKNETLFFHLENPKPSLQRIILDVKYPDGLIVTESGNERRCPLWAVNDSGTVPEAAATVYKSYVPVCDGVLYLRNRIQGHKTTLEWTTDFLRTRIPGGEKIIAIAKSVLFKDRFLSTAALKSAEAFTAESLHFSRKGPKMPPSASIGSSFRTFPASIRWSGYAPGRRRLSARRSENGSAMRTNGKAGAKDDCCRPIIPMPWLSENLRKRRSGPCARSTTAISRRIKPGRTGTIIKTASARPRA